MDENYNLSLIVIVNEQIELSNLFERAKKVGTYDLKLMPPQNSITLQQFTLSIGGMTPSFVLHNAVSGKDLIVFNMNYGNNIIRGVFQIQLLGTKGLDSGNTTFEALRDFVKQLNYSSVFAYEIGINLTIDHNEYPLFEMIKGLKTMKSPRYKAIKLLDEKNPGKDLREEYISDISLEQLINQPKKSTISAIYRTKEFDSNALQDTVSDIEKVIELVRS